MRNLKISFLASLLSSSASVFAGNQTVDGETDSLVALLLDTEAAEYREAREIHYAKDKTGMAFVFFTIEGFNGGNNHTFYLAAFEPNWRYDPDKGEMQQPNVLEIPKYRLVGYSPVGGKGWRSVDFANFTVEKGKIILQTKEYASGDPMCCPSKTGIATYLIEDQQLIELKPNNLLQPAIFSSKIPHHQ